MTTKKILLTATIVLFAGVTAICTGSNGISNPTEKITTDSDLKLETPHRIPLYGNAYVTNKAGSLRVTENGIVNWKDTDGVVSVYFKVNAPGKLNLAILGSGSSGKCELKATVEGTEFTVPIDKGTGLYPIGEITLQKAGYVRVDLQGATRTGKNFGTYTALQAGGEATGNNINIVPADWTYWGRRGPSVHMGYAMPQESVQYFYNEVTVPENNDVMSSYFMANGFGEGYMGMQVNSETERRVLFSVWSPFETDNPSSIPDDYKIKLLRRGKDVHIGEFGNEGSGGQSYLKYMWKPGVTYKFLTEVKPDGQGNTDYTGYFYASDEQEWRLIASFRRPHTDTWYTRAHSFLENFDPEMGYAERKVYFDNQWVRMTDGTWKELTLSIFTYDNTANSGIRFDYAGGLTDGKFYLRNCGFFDDNTKLRSQFTRPAKNIAPVIDLEALSQIPSVK